MSFYFKRISILFLFLLSLNVSAFCRSNLPKTLEIMNIHDETFDTFSNGKFTIKSSNQNAEILDIFDKNGYAVEGIITSTNVKKEKESRFFLLNWFLPEKYTYAKEFDFEISDNKLLEITGKEEVSFYVIFNVNNIKIRTNLVFKPDISDNCRP